MSFSSCFDIRPLSLTGFFFKFFCVMTSSNPKFNFPKYNYFSFVIVQLKEILRHPAVNWVNALTEIFKGTLGIR